MPTPATVTSQVIAETDFEITMLFTGSFVDTQETAVLKVDADVTPTIANQLPGATPTFGIKYVQYSATAPGVVKIYFDGTTKSLALQLGNSGELNFRSAPILDPQVTGYTGDIYFTTVGFASGGSYQLILTLQKNNDVFTSAPIVLSSGTSIYDGKSGEYAVGDTFEFKVAFNQPVFADWEVGGPEVDIILDNGTVKARYLGPETVSSVQCGDGTKFMTFHYTFQPGDSCAAGNFILSHIKGVMGTHSGALDVVDSIPSQSTSGFYVNVPTIGAVTGITNGHHYVSGNSVSVTVAFSQPMVVDTTGGTPYIVLDITSGNKNMSYASGSGTANLVFTYTPVVSGDVATAGGVSVDTSITLNSGTIENAGGTPPAAFTITPPTTTTVSVN